MLSLIGVGTICCFFHTYTFIIIFFFGLPLLLYSSIFVFSTLLVTCKSSLRITCPNIDYVRTGCTCSVIQESRSQSLAKKARLCCHSSPVVLVATTTDRSTVSVAGGVTDWELGSSNLNSSNSTSQVKVAYFDT